MSQYLKREKSILVIEKRKEKKPNGRACVFKAWTNDWLGQARVSIFLKFLQKNKNGRQIFSKNLVLF
jgi:hypothetical protein